MNDGERSPKWRRALLLLSAVVHCGGAALADEIPSAVGRITYGDVSAPGTAICSGALVAPDLVLTAAHCVRSSAMNPASIRFDLGWSAGTPAGRGRGAEVLLPGGSELADDVALVVLAEPVPKEVAEPLLLTAPFAKVFLQYGFRRDAPDHPSHPIACFQVAADSALVGLGCRAVSGNSGAPLLQLDGDNWQVVAVMVAASDEGPVHSWAALPPGWVVRRISAHVD